MKNWGFKKFDLVDRWPKDENGKPEEPVFLTHSSEVQMESEMIINMLSAYNIPVVCRYENNGDFGRVMIGLSGTGVDLYVPSSMLQDAQNIMSCNIEDDSENTDA